MQVPVLKTCYRHTKMFIRSWLEYYGVAFHSSLTKQQESSLERCQAVCLRLILEESYISYSAALEMSGLKTLSSRRLDRCLQFSLKSIKHEQNKRMFPPNPNLGNDIHIRRTVSSKLCPNKLIQKQCNTLLPASIEQPLQREGLNTLIN